MPIYDFLCQNCGNRFDQLTKFEWRSAGVKCPVCQSDNLVRPVTAVGLCCSSGNGGDETSVMSSSAGSACAHCHSSNCKTCH